jgi:hypothetical protein
MNNIDTTETAVRGVRRRLWFGLCALVFFAGLAGPAVAGAHQFTTHMAMSCVRVRPTECGIPAPPPGWPNGF